MLLDARAGKAAKDAGMQLALDFAGQEWKERVIPAFAAWAAVQRYRGFKTCTIEAFRADNPGVQPQSHKAWGSLPKLLLTARLVHENLDERGEPHYRRAAAPKTRCHPIRVWGLI